MSDEDVRTLFEEAEDWSPDSNPNMQPPLQLGSDVDIANCVAQLLRQRFGEVVFCEGQFWHFSRSHWRQIEHNDLRRSVHTYDGAVVPGSRAPVKLSKNRIDSVINEMTAILARSDFFAEAPIGINCASGFIAFSREGDPSLTPHAPDHRCRHVLKGSWENGFLGDPEKQFIFARLSGCLLARLLEGLFLGDPDAKEKRQLLAEIAGAAALGYGTKVRQPKAVILEGRTAENGKSQVLDLFRGLLPPEAIAAIPAAKMGDERFVVGLLGKHLNASDELSGAEAIAGDVFKAVVTGEPVTGRDVYRPALTFRSVAQNVFATNTLPTFKGGMDRGVRRRLLVLTFNRTIPEQDRVENIGLRIADEEADMLLAWAVAGAAHLICQRGFTTPASSKTALQEWLLGADPVIAWIDACLEEVDPRSADGENALIKRQAAYDHFIRWAEREGFSKNTLPGVNTFANRLRANRPKIEQKHTSKGNYLAGFRINSAEDAAEAGFPFDAPLS